MPEFPEVETTVRGLQKVLNRTFVNVWTDSKKQIKMDFNEFEKKIKGKKIKKIWRRGKNIIFNLSEDCSLLIHQKMSGHMLYDKWDESDRHNSYIHLKFTLDNGKTLALSDLRKFAKVEFKKTEDIIEDLKALGPEPLEIDFNRFKGIFKNRKGKIKQILMKQELIAGIGNIYSDEILWEAKIHPFRDISKLTEQELEDVYKAMGQVLKKSLGLGGSSISDYRNIYGKKGAFGNERKVYGKEGQECPRCKTKFQRKKINNRSTCFCSKCQT